MTTPTATATTATATKRTGLTVTDVARGAGVSANAVRYYERYEVVTADRTSGNARRFTVDAICRVKLAVAAQRVGLSLAESARILADVPRMCPDPKVWSAAAQKLVDAGNARIAELESVVDEYRELNFLRS